MNEELIDKLKAIRQKQESIYNKLHVVLAWVLIILCSLVIIAFLYRCFEAVLGRDTLTGGDWLGFLVCLGFLAAGILYVYNPEKKDPD